MTQINTSNTRPVIAGNHAAIHRYIHLRLKALGLPTADGDAPGDELDEIASGLLANFQQKNRLLKDYRCPVDRRIETFLREIFAPYGIHSPLRLPDRYLSIHRPGVARELSLPKGHNQFTSSLVSSYRVANGVLHNPANDRRTTQGTFHIADCGMPVPADKIAVPPAVYARLFIHAINPPPDLLDLPYTARSRQTASIFCSLLLRPIVVPEIPPGSPQKTMEIHFFVPGSLVSNLDFVESIFGNAGDPVLPENDAGLDVAHWTGHTGCVILAPHLTQLTKKSLGLPPWDEATPRQQRDGMCWKNPGELYNGGSAFKITCRGPQGVMATIIADNYFGYCKKEVKTQISFAANLLGNAEEEHAGGAVAFPSYSMGTEFTPHEKYWNGRTFADVVRDYAPLMDVHPEGYGVDRQFPEIVYLPENAHMNLHSLRIIWDLDGKPQSRPLQVDKIYLTPSGQKLFLHKHPGSNRFRIVVTAARGVFCHKPCTVSGGGKSEISKSISDYMIFGPIYVANLKNDLDQVQAILDKDHAQRWKPGHKPDHYAHTASRPILGATRSLGSVIKMLAPSNEYTDDYNRWLAAIPSDILALVFLIKRLYKPEWGEDWRSHFSVDIVNGEPGHELKMDDRKAAGTYLRVGLLPSGAWNTFKVRQDFFPAAKVQMEDDITASTVVPTGQLQINPQATSGPSVKLVSNCELRLFQRPDDAVIPGLDRQTELDMSGSDNFISNYEPLDTASVRQIMDNVTEFESYTPPMRKLLRDAAQTGCGFVVSSAHPRLVNGKRTKNPRYLQYRPDLANQRDTYIASVAYRLAQAIPLGIPITFPVDAVLLGRRNNPPDVAAGIRSLAVYNPIHYQELPELFMDFISSLTGKSPSTTGAGSEGALTKGPFNALLTTADLNAALVSYILTGLAGFSTAAGYVGPKYKMGHDISLLIPELWCRMGPAERDPQFLIAGGYMEKLEDFSHNGVWIPASRLGFRVTSRFMRTFLGRIFDNPARIFDSLMLKPELQDMEAFVDGVLNISQTQQRVAMQYFDDGSVNLACPPLKALLHIMAYGEFEGKGANHPDIRAMFTLKYLLGSNWYKQRLINKQRCDVVLYERHVQYLHNFIEQSRGDGIAESLKIPERLAFAKSELSRAASPEYLKSLEGTIGVDAF